VRAGSCIGTFIVAAACTFFLSYPPTDYVVHGTKGDLSFSLALGPAGFVFLMSALGLFLSFGKAAVYKHIPVYYPGNVGVVGGAVGMVGGLGGFLLLLTFGMLNDLTGIWSSCFHAVVRIGDDCADLDALFGCANGAPRCA